MRNWFGFGLAVCLALEVLASSAGAELVKFTLHKTTIFDGSNRYPNCFGITANPGERCDGKAVVELSVAGPVLRRFAFITDVAGTVPNLGCCHSQYLSLNEREGPTGSATGSGSTAAGSTLRWGSVTGWTISGTTWCSSVPKVLCTLAGAMDLTTTDPIVLSSFYDLGTWSFHGTGFTSVPFVAKTFTNILGNNMRIYRGARMNDSNVPALPALAIFALGALFVGGAGMVLRRGPN